MSAGDRRPRWDGASATFRTRGVLTEGGWRLLLGSDPSQQRFRLGLQYDAPEGRTFTGDDAARLAGTPVQRLVFEVAGTAMEFGPGAVSEAEVVEGGAAMRITLDGKGPRVLANADDERPPGP